MSVGLVVDHGKRDSADHESVEEGAVFSAEKFHHEGRSFGLFTFGTFDSSPGRDSFHELFIEFEEIPVKGGGVLVAGHGSCSLVSRLWLR